MKTTKLFELQKEIALFLLNKIETMELSPERAAKIARYVLSLLKPKLTENQVEQLLIQLKDNCVELTQLIQYFRKKQDEIIKNDVVIEAEKLIKMGKVNQAINVLNSFTNKTQ